MYMKTLQIRNREINRLVNYLKYTMISYSNHSHKTYNLKEMLTFIMAFLQFHLKKCKNSKNKKRQEYAERFFLTSLDGANLSFKMASSI